MKGQCCTGAGCTLHTACWECPGELTTDCSTLGLQLVSSLDLSCYKHAVENVPAAASGNKVFCWRMNGSTFWIVSNLNRTHPHVPKKEVEKWNRWMRLKKRERFWLCRAAPAVSCPVVRLIIPDTASSKQGREGKGVYAAAAVPAAVTRGVFLHSSTVALQHVSHWLNLSLAVIPKSRHLLWHTAHCFLKEQKNLWALEPWRQSIFQP